MEHKATHTAGPWFVAANGLNKVATITNVTGIYSDVAPDDKSIAADARLIAAAPRLIEALRAVVATEMFLPDHPQRQAAYKAARAAIAKATQ